MSSTGKVNRKSRLRRAGVVAALSALACLSGGWTIQSCDEASNDPAVVASGCDATFCTTGSGGERCKFGLRNVRHRYFAGLPNGQVTEIYFGGQRTKWCWRGGSITARHTDFPLGWTSYVGSGGVSHSTYSSSCGTGNAQCLVREDFLARMDVTIPVIGVPVGVTDRFCVGSRVYAGGAHTRNISNGPCPGGAALASAGLAGFSVAPMLERRITQLAFSRRNVRHMARHDGRPLPQLGRLLRRAYRQLSPAEKRKLRSLAEFEKVVAPAAPDRIVACIARLGTTCGKGG
jgi:hypothetical protein